MTEQKNRCWAEISLSNLKHNYDEIRGGLPENCKFLGVMKANAYGHGAVTVAKTLEDCGADYLAVAFLEEAEELRNNGIKLPILILGYTFPERTSELIKYDITQTVGSFESAEEYEREAAKLGKTLKCHLTIDSGMGRLGFEPPLDIDKIAEVLSKPNLSFEGVFTHFAVSDMDGEENEEYTRKQYALFMSTVHNLETKWGKKFDIIHCTNSGAMISYPQTYSGMVRPGIALYGCYPGQDRGKLKLRPVMSLKTRIVHIKDVKPGDSISYGRIWTAQRESKIAVLSVGYADGLARTLSNRAEFMLHGRRIHQVGRICMDMCMADVTDIIDVKVGDEVLVFGMDSQGLLPVEEHAEKIGTISYELLCDVAERVPRVYTY